MKNVINVLKIFVMMMMISGVAVQAAQGQTASDFVINQYGVLIGYNGPGGDVVIPEGVVAIVDMSRYVDGNYDEPPFTSVVIPNSVIFIGELPFYDQPTLTRLTLGSSVATISTESFYRCPNLTEIHSKNPTPPDFISDEWPFVYFDYDVYNNLSSYRLVNLYETCKLYVPTGSLAAYRSATGWRHFKQIYEEPADAPAPSPADTAHVSITIYDTTHVTVTVYDTILVTINLGDTIWHTVDAWDTAWQHITLVDTTLEPLTVYDTVVREIHDTLVREVHDTLVREIHDTVYIVIDAGAAVAYTVSENARAGDIGQGVFLSGLTAGAPYAVYSLSGTLVAQGISSASGDALISPLPAGTYLLSHGGNWSKFVHLTP